MRTAFAYRVVCRNEHEWTDWNKLLTAGVTAKSFAPRCTKCGELGSVYLEEPPPFGPILRVSCPDCIWQWNLPLMPDMARNGISLIEEPYDPMKETRHWWVLPDFAQIPPHQCKGRH